MRLSGYNKNLEEVYKNHTYITKKEDGKKERMEKIEWRRAKILHNAETYLKVLMAITQCND